VQQRIAAILDAADALRTTRREALAQLDTLLQSTFLDMFGDPVTNPMGWEEIALGDVCIEKPAYGSGAAACAFAPSLPRYVRITDVDDSGELAGDPKSAELDTEEIEKYRLKEGDVLLARSGATVGKSYLYRPRNGFCVYAGYMIRFRPDPERLLSETLFRYTQTTAYWRWVGTQARAVAQPNINAKMYSALPIFLPPLSLQHRFAAIVESVDEQKTRMRSHLAELDALFACLQSRAFNGEL
jgi:type I restriction enzyme S subunit